MGVMKSISQSFEYDLVDTIMIENRGFRSLGSGPPPGRCNFCLLWNAME